MLFRRLVIVPDLPQYYRQGDAQSSDDERWSEYKTPQVKSLGDLVQSGYGHECIDRADRAGYAGYAYPQPDVKQKP